ncbi:hypothetical protein IscW_ISCW002884 [Ixodes scapularis]|uniref:Uncharacterized protein n=1 Tax=Ixodes scapularis TaxID=6945 RepID=B7P8Z2_IXOSC|nr:hypothetical protein IscW_ISCW002884 [Ixodes scapularis]|eukprot:XP_002403334.1 hypothetical protein IscW_ISCW002884 [Ixodes scapularis]
MHLLAATGWEERRQLTDYAEEPTTLGPAALKRTRSERERSGVCARTGGGGAQLPRHVFPEGPPRLTSQSVGLGTTSSQLARWEPARGR